MDKNTIIRTIVLIGALINQMLIPFNMEPIPGEHTVWYDIISTIITAIAALWNWFYNNYITLKGRKQREVLKQHNLLSE